MNIGFIELGRSMDPNPGRHGPVRNDALNLYSDLSTAAAARGDAVRAVGRVKGGPFVADDWKSQDALVVWVNQHPAVSIPNRVPKLHQDGTGLEFVKPLQYAQHYCAYVWEAAFSKPVVWVCNDPRSRLQAREVQGPQTILAAHRETNQRTFFNFASQQHELTHDAYQYAGVELIGLQDLMQFPWDNDNTQRDIKLLVVANEVKPGGPLDRAKLIQKLVPEDALVVGKWSPKGMERLGREVKPVDWKKLPELWARAQYTLVLPTSGTGWITAKIWEAYSTGAVPIVVPPYDDQNWSDMNPYLTVPTFTREEVEEIIGFPPSHDLRGDMRRRFEEAIDRKMHVQRILAHLDAVH